MILKGSQRSGALKLAAHLLNDRDNDHIELHELRGFTADDLRGALRESEAIAKPPRIRRQNETEAADDVATRDASERESMISSQLSARRTLQQERHASQSNVRDVREEITREADRYHRICPEIRRPTPEAYVEAAYRLQYLFCP